MSDSDRGWPKLASTMDATGAADDSGKRRRRNARERRQQRLRADARFVQRLLVLTRVPAHRGFDHDGVARELRARLGSLAPSYRDEASQTEAALQQQQPHRQQADEADTTARDRASVGTGPPLGLPTAAQLDRKTAAASSAQDAATYGGQGKASAPTPPPVTCNRNRMLKMLSEHNITIPVLEREVARAELVIKALPSDMDHDDIDEPTRGLTTTGVLFLEWYNKLYAWDRHMADSDYEWFEVWVLKLRESLAKGQGKGKSKSHGGKGRTRPIGS